MVCLTRFTSLQEKAFSQEMTASLLIKSNSFMEEKTKLVVVLAQGCKSFTKKTFGQELPSLKVR
jgi:hypothetical protein